MHWLKTLCLSLAILLCGTAIVQQPVATVQKDEAAYVTERQTPGIVLPIAILYSDIERYPHIIRQLRLGAQMWQEAIPVHFKLHIAINSSDSIPYGAIKVIIADLKAMGLRHPTAGAILQGMWDVENRILFLDRSLETWESDRRKLYDDGELKEEPRLSPMGSAALHVVVHELGHVLGLPHIIGMNDDNGVPNYPCIQTGAIVVEDEAEARTYIMYPYTDQATGISRLEAELAMVRLGLPLSWLK